VELEALTDCTANSITADLLRRLPEWGVFVNVARAGLVVEEDLIEVASEGRVRFGLDVFHREPLSPDSPLMGLNNVTVTPHNAGPTPDTLHLCGRNAVENLRRWTRGQPVESIIDLGRYEHMT